MRVFLSAGDRGCGCLEFWEWVVEKRKERPQKLA